MVLAMTLNLMLAALMGVLIPMTMLKLGRDPAVGSSVLITAVTDSGGFFIFLGLATLFLISGIMAASRLLDTSAVAREYSAKAPVGTP